MKALLLLLLVVLGGAGFFTRPTVERHQAVVEKLAARGSAAPVAPDAARELLVDDYYVLTHSRLMAGGAPVLECWGAFTRFFCTRPDAS